MRVLVQLFKQIQNAKKCNLTGNLKLSCWNDVESTM